MKKSNLYCSRAFLLTAVCSYSLMANSAMSPEEAYDKLSSTSIKQCKEVGIVLNKQNVNTFLHMIPASKILKIVNQPQQKLSKSKCKIFAKEISMEVSDKKFNLINKLVVRMKSDCKTYNIDIPAEKIKKYFQRMPISVLQRASKLKGKPADKECSMFKAMLDKRQ